MDVYVQIHEDFQTADGWYTVAFRTSAEKARWCTVLSLLVQRAASPEEVAEVCRLIYEGPVWQYQPPCESATVMLFTPFDAQVREAEGKKDVYGWAFTPTIHFVRRYDGTAQQAEEAMAAEPVR